MAIVLFHVETVHETLSDAIYYFAARAAFRSSCSNGDAIRSISPFGETILCGFVAPLTLGGII